MSPIHFDNLDTETAMLVESNLPASAKEFVRLIGLPATLALISEFGGTDLSFPKKEDGQAADSYAHIAEIIGHQEIKLLIAHFSNAEEVYIPRAAKALAKLRNRQIVDEWDKLTKTMSGRRATNTLALKFRMSAVNVHNIVNGSCSPSRAKPTDTQ